MSERQVIRLAGGYELALDDVGPRAGEGMPYGFDDSADELFFRSHTRGVTPWLAHNGFDFERWPARLQAAQSAGRDRLWLMHPTNPAWWVGVRRFYSDTPGMPGWMYGVKLVDGREIDWLQVLVFGGYGYTGFADTLLANLRAAEDKYGYGDAWRREGWRAQLLKDIRDHLAKGDPRDVAAYCAFAHWHGWSVAPEEPGR